ncbi:alkaline phosphatase [bacterium]|nr:alkaline phosphatase [bacterium]
MNARNSIVVVLALLIAAPLVAGTISVDTSFYTAPADKTLPLVAGDHAKNVILLIGDGMGYCQVEATQYTAVGPEGRLHMQTLPVTGMMSTWSADRLITDSAASGTAMATGYKTDNRRIGTLPNGQKPVSILEAAEQRGLATGLVATSTITHATPAAFAAHQPSRYDQPAIAVDMAASGVDVVLGSGYKYWQPAPDGVREDGLDLLQQLQNDGYRLARTGDEMMALDRMPAIGLYGPDALDETPDEPSIADLTRKAIELLSQDDDGFFLMVEGSQIDWEAHSNEEDELVRRALLFDLAVAEAIEFAKQDGNTLVIITADHETGGMTLTKGNRDGSEVVAQFSSTGHTAGSMPVFAYGPGALAFTGLYENSDLAVKMARVLQISDFPRLHQNSDSSQTLSD